MQFEPDPESAATSGLLNYDYRKKPIQFIQKNTDILNCFFNNMLTAIYENNTVKTGLRAMQNRIQTKSQ